jgi:hypothetical protein
MPMTAANGGRRRQPGGGARDQAKAWGNGAGRACDTGSCSGDGILFDRPGAPLDGELHGIADA